jgi:Cof subfamily protein (haloacid dehalogenase superfamily)
MIHPYLAPYGLDDKDILISVNNGAQVYNNKTRETIYQQLISIDNVILLLKTLRELDVDLYTTAQLYIQDQIYINQHTDFTLRFVQRSGIAMNCVGDLLDYVASNQLLVDKVCLIWDKVAKLDIDAMFGCLAQAFDVTVSGTIGTETLVEITSNRAGKGNTAIWIASKLNIPMQNMICIGDGNNDISMIGVAGLGIAMFNAIAELKAVAGMIADSCDNDGVAKIMEQAMQDVLK